MKVLTRQTPSRTRRRLGRGAADAAPVAPPSAPQPHPPSLRERDAGGPEDRACYQCACGYVFEAPVSASVDCPHCGGEQAW
jgi:hypothetical protein